MRREELRGKGIKMLTGLMGLKFNQRHVNCESKTLISSPFESASLPEIGLQMFKFFLEN